MAVPITYLTVQVTFQNVTQDIYPFLCYSFSYLFFLKSQLITFWNETFHMMSLQKRLHTSYKGFKKEISIQGGL